MNLKEMWKIFESRCFKAGDWAREKYPRTVRWMGAFEEWLERNAGRMFWLMLSCVAVWAWLGRSPDG